MIEIPLNLLDGHIIPVWRCALTVGRTAKTVSGPGEREEQNGYDNDYR